MEGKEILRSCIQNVKKTRINYSQEDLVIDDINLYDLLTRIVDNVDNFAYVSTKVIDYILNEQSINDDEYFRDLIQARDLLLGKMEYSLKVDLKSKLTSQIERFQKDLCDFLDRNYPGIIESESVRYKLRVLEDAVELNKLIIDFEFVEQIVKEYDSDEFDNNMLSVISYINSHNLEVMKIKKVNAPKFDIQFVKKPKLDDSVIEILDKIGISCEDLPNYLLSELKKANPKKLYDTFCLMKKNKAEDGGILHLIPKTNSLLKLILLLYSSDTVINDIISTLKMPNGLLNIGVVKILLAQVPSVFIEKSNEYFKPKYQDFKNNMKILKENEVNYPALINKCPLYVIMDSSIMEYTLGYLNKEGASIKKIINKCYKVLANDPSLLIENLNILKKNQVNIEEFFNVNTNYSLLKVKHLDKTIKDIIKLKGENSVKNIELMNSMLLHLMKESESK